MAAQEAKESKKQSSKVPFSFKAQYFFRLLNDVYCSVILSESPSQGGNKPPDGHGPRQG